MATSFVTCIHLRLLCSASLNASFVLPAHHNNTCLRDTSTHHRAKKIADLFARASNSVSWHPIDRCKLTVRNRASCICGRSRRPRPSDMVPRFLDLVSCLSRAADAPPFDERKHGLGHLFIHDAARNRTAKQTKRETQRESLHHVWLFLLASTFTFLVRSSSSHYCRWWTFEKISSQVC